MIREINRNPEFLSIKSEPAEKADLPVATDLLDTLKANRERCVGMAANMIGVSKRIIAISMGARYLVMLNPVIVKRKDPYPAEEGCLSLDGIRSTTRYRSIQVEYQDMKLRKQKQEFVGYTAQIIQHEIDHCDGILI